MPPVHPPEALASTGRGKKSEAQPELWKKEWKGAEGLAEDVRYYGKWMRDEAFKRIGHLYPPVKVTAEILADRPDLEARGLKPGDELTVIAWLWARTVKCPNPACGAQMPLVRSFALSTKKDKEIWAEPLLDHGARPPEIHFKVKTGKSSLQEGSVIRTGATCLACHTAVPLDYVRTEGKAGRMDAQLIAIVAEGMRGRVYLPPLPEHEKTARRARPEWKPEQELQGKCRVSVPLYGMNTFGDLFTSRQLVTLTTFSGMVSEAHALTLHTARTPRDRDLKLYADAIATYLAFAMNKYAVYGSSLVPWYTKEDRPSMLLVARQFQWYGIMLKSIHLLVLGEDCKNP
jgi:putative DNA methylase